MKFLLITLLFPLHSHGFSMFSCLCLPSELIYIIFPDPEEQVLLVLYRPTVWYYLKSLVSGMK